MLTFGLNMVLNSGAFRSALSQIQQQFQQLDLQAERALSRQDRMLMSAIAGYNQFLTAAGRVMSTVTSQMRESVSEFDTLDVQLRNIQLRLGMSATEDNSPELVRQYNSIRDAAMEAAASARYSSSEVVAALDEMIRSGMRPDEAIIGLPAVVDLAVASGGQLTLPQSGSLFSTARNVVGIGTDEFARFGDELLSLEQNSRIALGSMEEMMKSMGPTFANFAESGRTEILGIAAALSSVRSPSQVGSDLLALSRSRNYIWRAFQTADPQATISDVLASAGSDEMTPGGDPASRTRGMRVRAEGIEQLGLTRRDFFDERGNQLQIGAMLQNIEAARQRTLRGLEAAGSDMAVGQAAVDSAIAQVFANQQVTNIFSMLRFTKQQHGLDPLAITSDMDRATGKMRNAVLMINDTISDSTARLDGLIRNIRYLLVEPIKPILMQVLTVVLDLANAFAQLLERYPNLSRTIATSTVVFTVLLGILILLASGVYSMILATSLLAPLMVGAGAASMTMTTAFAMFLKGAVVPMLTLIGPFVMGLISIAAAMYALYYSYKQNVGGLKTVVDGMAEFISNVWEAMMAFAKGETILASRWLSFSDTQRETIRVLMISWGRLKDFFGGFAEGAKFAFEMIGVFVSGLLSTGQFLFKWAMKAALALGLVTAGTEFGAQGFRLFGWVVGGVIVGLITLNGVFVTMRLLYLSMIFTVATARVVFISFWASVALVKIIVVVFTETLAFMKVVWIALTGGISISKAVIAAWSATVAATRTGVIAMAAAMRAWAAATWLATAPIFGMVIVAGILAGALYYLYVQAELARTGTQRFSMWVDVLRAGVALLAIAVAVAFLTFVGPIAALIALGVTAAVMLWGIRDDIYLLGVYFLDWIRGLWVSMSDMASGFVDWGKSVVQWILEGIQSSWGMLVDFLYEAIASLPIVGGVLAGEGAEVGIGGQRRVNADGSPVRPPTNWQLQSAQSGSSAMLPRNGGRASSVDQSMRIDNVAITVQANPNGPPIGPAVRDGLMGANELRRRGLGGTGG